PARRRGRGTGRRAPAGKRDRHGDLRDRGYCDGGERAPADASGEGGRVGVVAVQPSVEPRLPPWWLDEAGEGEEAPPLEGDVQAEVAIVGGGYTGLWTALAVREREPAARVVVLEAETCGAGPSGRNGGFCHGYWSHLASLREVLGDADTLEVARAAGPIIPAGRALAGDGRLRVGRHPTGS